MIYDDDVEYFPRVIVASEKIRFVSEARSYYRHANPKSLSRDLSDKACESLFLSISLCIGYLRSLEDSERTRAACLMFLQNSLIGFYPEHAVILKKTNDLAKELGGTLSPPVLNWKYSIIKGVFGWRLAKRAQRLIPIPKFLIIRNWDKLLYNLSK